MKAIGDIIALHKPDVVCLQEITPAHFAACLRHPAFGGFHWSQPGAGRYYTMLGSRIKFREQRTPFACSGMGRDLLFAQIQPEGSLPPLVVGTSHLESLGESRKRAQQIKDSCKWLGKSGVADLVFCGDTNIQAADGEVSLPSPWQDAWTSLRPSEPGFTWDVEQNQMMNRCDDYSRSNHLQLRFDRFWTRLASYSAAQIQIVGDQPFKSSDGKELLWPSDHFGVLLTLVPTVAVTTPSVGPAGPAGGQGVCGCGEPTWNGQLGQKCRISCPAPTFCMTGCGKPSWNGEPGERCAKTCQGGDHQTREHGGYPLGASALADWSLANTREVAREKVPQALVFSGTEAPTDAVEMLNRDRRLWPNLNGQCYVWSSYKTKWYLMWSGVDGPPTRLPDVSRFTKWQDWSLANTTTFEPGAVPKGLVFNGTQAPTDAVQMLNADRSLWPNLRGECYVWSSYKSAYYRMWPGSSKHGDSCKCFKAGFCKDGAHCQYGHAV